MNIQGPSIQGIETAPQGEAAYAYTLRYEDFSDALFLTQWQEPVSIAGLPPRFGAANPQTFIPAQIAHDTIARQAEFDRHAFQVSARFDTGRLSSFFVSCPTTPMIIEIIRIAKGAISSSGDPVQWGIDTYVVQTGVIEDISLRGDLVTAGCVPRPFHMESGVPRLWFNRTCQWALYGRGCGVNKAAFKWESQIKGLNRAKRRIIVNGAPSGEPNDYFHGGFLTHNPTGQFFTCLRATKNAGGDTVLTIGAWSSELETGDQVALYPGCNRTVSNCRDRFGNEENFGGFSRLPDKNPSIHGA